MGLLDMFRKKPPEAPLPMISLLDKSGRQIQVTQQQWRDSILPATLKQYHNDPEQLSGVIVGALQMGFFQDILEASRHLCATDPLPARGACLYAIALMKLKRLDEAEQTIRTCLATHGENVALLTNLAKIHAERNDDSEAEATLWHALEVDPNYENAVVWYSARGHDRGGKPAQTEALEQMAALPGSWRAQVYLARTALENRDLGKAVALYRAVIAHAPDPAPAAMLMQLTGDLGMHGYSAEAVELGSALYSVDVHGASVGNNLMKAHFDLGQYDRARSILNQLRLRARPEEKQVVDYWEAQLRNR